MRVGWSLTALYHWGLIGRECPRHILPSSVAYRYWKKGHVEFMRSGTKNQQVATE